MSQTVLPYRVLADATRPGCARCGAAQFWVIVNLDDREIGVPHSDKDHAQYHTNLLNAAFTAGWKRHAEFIANTAKES